jgi:hypothetical protein
MSRDIRINTNLEVYNPMEKYKEMDKYGTTLARCEDKR